MKGKSALTKVSVLQLLTAMLLIHTVPVVIVSAQVPPIELIASEASSIHEEGFVPYYKEGANLAINAALHKNSFASSKFIFPGKNGEYDVTLHTILETDGESKYRVKINGKVIGEFQNPETAKHGAFTFTLEKIKLQHGDVIHVQSNTHSNKKVPEGDDFGFSRGRWKKLVFQSS